jgi:pimeloyl-ACP methyl ester carboxylesterase
VVIDQGQGLSIERGFERSQPLGWTKVFKEIQRTARILMHDRAGLGSSDPPPGPRTGAQMVGDLRAVLHAAQLPPPYVLVGHSIGGLNVRLFAGTYPMEVAGVVLVDSSHPDHFKRFASTLPPETADEALPLKALRRGPGAVFSGEAIDFHACAEEARGIASIGEKPLVVVSQSRHALAPPGIPLAVWEKMQAIWSELQGDLVGLSSLGTHVVAKHAGHHIQLEEPELVVDAISSVVRDVQGASKRTRH